MLLLKGLGSMEMCQKAIDSWDHVDTLSMEARAHGFTDVEIGDDGTGGYEVVMRDDNMSRVLRAKAKTVKDLVKKVQEMLHG